MNIKEAAKRIKKSEPTIRRMIKDGKITATMVNGKWDISESDLIDLSFDQLNDHLIMVDQLRKEVDHLRGQLDQKDKQIDQLQQLLMVSQSNQASNQKLLEYYQEPIWKRWFKKKETLASNKLFDKLL